MNPLVFLTMLVVIMLMPISSYADSVSISVNKSQYKSGDSIILSGQIDDPQPGQFVIVQIINPQNSDFAAVDTFLPYADGGFSKSYKADGPKWMIDGIYTVKVFYGGQEHQTSFQFTHDEKTTSLPKSSEKPKVKPLSPDPLIDTSSQPKTHVLGFPALDKSPQYYIDRYSTDSAFKNWFDSQFPQQGIDEVVGYPKTHTPDFPKLDRSPQYYVDWYSTADDFRDWFDAQFPNETIYTVLGFPNPPPIPDWIKNNAGWWSTRQISDDEFVTSIQFMIVNNIILLPDLTNSQNASTDPVPDWIRNTANWWSMGKISDDEFVTAIKFLVEEGIIQV